MFVMSIVFSAFLPSPSARSETLSSNASFTQRLMEPHSAIIEGSSLRNAIGQVSGSVAVQSSAEQRTLNIWLDRKVDPTYLVSPGSLGPTRYHSLCQIAAEAGCVCVPINECVLIGRASWVDGIAQQIFGDTKTVHAIKRSQPVSIAWPDLTTPDETLSILRTKSISPTLIPRSLPHDLWAAQRWEAIPGGVAALLISSQFVAFDPTETAKQSFQRSYHFDALETTSTTELLSIVRSVDAEAAITKTGKTVALAAQAAAHRRFANHCLIGDRSDQNARGQNGAGPGDRAGMNQPVADGDGEQFGSRLLEKLQKNERTFTLKVENKPAGAILVTLLAQVGLTCEMDTRVNQQLQRRVSFTAKGETAWQLVSRVLQLTGLDLVARDGKLHVVVQTPG